MESSTPEALASLLRAVADPRRLRLLALCAEGPATVSALASAVGDSEPNVSRQLKQLAAASLVRRMRQGQFVEYSAVTEGSAAAEAVRWLLARLDRDDAGSRAARAALRRARLAADPGRASPAMRLSLAPSRFGRALCAALLAGGAPSATRVLLGCRQPELLEALASGASRVGLLARAATERAPLARWAIAAGLDAEVELASAFQAGPVAGRWDLVVLDASVAVDPDAGSPGTTAAAASGTAPEAQLELARSLLAPGGCAWLLCDYDALEAGAARAARVAPPQRLRALLQAAGFECRDVVPVEAEGRHVLVARSLPLRAAVAPLVRSA